MKWQPYLNRARMKANRKAREGHQHPDRNAQCESINSNVRRFLRRGLDRRDATTYNDAQTGRSHVTGGPDTLAKGNAAARKSVGLNLRGSRRVVKVSTVAASRLPLYKDDYGSTVATS